MSTVSTGSTAGAESVAAPPAAPPAAPLAFRWRGRRYVVSHVLADWVEVEPWWGATGSGATGESEQRWWRVEAGRHSVAVDDPGLVTGVFDLCWREGTWSMRRITD
ncbi:MAG: DUF6504 family protein [Actinomycetes bacterium]